MQKFFDISRSSKGIARFRHKGNARRVQRMCYIACLCLLWTMMGCSKSSDPEAARDSQAPETEETTPADPANDAPSEGAQSEAEDLWTASAVQEALKQDGWTIDAQKPEPTGVATPDGTQVDGWTVERDTLRADIFLYTYPRAGYARAHANAQGTLERTAVVQHDARVIAVVGRDAAHAQEVLQALPSAYAPKTDKAP